MVACKLPEPSKRMIAASVGLLHEFLTVWISVADLSHAAPMLSDKHDMKNDGARRWLSSPNHGDSVLVSDLVGG